MQLKALDQINKAEDMKDVHRAGLGCWGRQVTLASTLETLAHL